MKYFNNEKNENLKNTGSLIGVGAAIGAAVFVATNEPTWIGVGIAVGAAIGWLIPKDKNEGGKYG